MTAEITMESVGGMTMYRIGGAYFPFLSIAMLTAFSIGMEPVITLEAA